MRKFIYPGQLATVRSEGELATILGSCVAVILHDPIEKIAGMNHHVLPASAGVSNPTFRYADISLPKLLEDLIELGARQRNLKAFIVGGAQMFEGEGQARLIGARNIEAAEDFLKVHGIPVAGRESGGTKGRRVSFSLSSGVPVVNSTEDQVSGIAKPKVVRSVRVAIVDDSATIRTLFSNTFKASGLNVVGTAADAYQARELLVKEKPDVVTLDIEMPKMNGVAFLEKLLEHFPLPVVMVSSLGADGDAARRALELGAIEFVNKPSQFDPSIIKALSQTLVEKVQAAASIDIKAHIARIKSQQTATSKAGSSSRSVRSTAERSSSRRAIHSGAIDLIAITGNAGAQDRLKLLLPKLASDSPPVVVVCATLSGFAQSWINSLPVASGLQLSVAKDGEALYPGRVYFAPAGQHLEVRKTQTHLVAAFAPASLTYSQCPSADHLFKTVCDAGLGPRTVGFVTSGFGADGVKGASRLAESGGILYVDEPQNVLFPHAIDDLISGGFANQVLSIDQFAGELMAIRNKGLTA